MMKIYLLNIHDIKEQDIEEFKIKYPKRYLNAQKYRFKEDFLRSIGAYILLGKAFNNFKEDDIILGKYGKPNFHGKINFNYSHSGDYVVLAVDENSVGIDIEKINNKDVVISERIFSNEELNWMNEKDKILRFFIIWCKKESYVKCKGETIDFSIKNLNVLRFNNSENNLDYHNLTFTFKDYVISVTSRYVINLEECPSELKLFKEI